MKKCILHASLLLVILCTACKKDEPVSIQTKTELLTDGSWIISSILSDADGNGSYESDDFALFPDCYKDNFYTFKEDLEVEMNEGAMKCDPMDPQISSIVWTFTSNETSIVIDTDTYRVAELSNNTLKLKQEYGNNKNTMLTFTKR
jgi:hypothetical protein